MQTFDILLYIILYVYAIYLYASRADPCVDVRHARTKVYAFGVSVGEVGGGGGKRISHCAVAQGQSLVYAFCMALAGLFIYYCVHNALYLCVYCVRIRMIGLVYLTNPREILNCALVMSDFGDFFATCCVLSAKWLVV